MEFILGVAITLLIVLILGITYGNKEDKINRELERLDREILSKFYLTGEQKINIRKYIRIVL